MKDSRDIIENLNMVLPVDFGFWALWALISALVIGLLVLAGWRLHRQGRLPFFQHPPVPPHVLALRRLAEIRGLIVESAMRDFVREASGILRAYIEARFNLRAPFLSREEFLAEARHSNRLDAADRERLSEFLFSCDCVKFALASLAEADMEALLVAAETFVRETMEPAREPAEAQ